MYTHQKNLQTGGTEISIAKRALTLLHGRGGTAGNMLNLADEFSLTETAFIAPQATHNSWYPYSFMVDEKENQPALDSALNVIDQIVNDLIEQDIPKNKIYLLGFSQGACLTLEYLARNAARFGGGIAFTGGLIGQKLQTERYNGDFAGTPLLITTGNPDPHVPLNRVEESISVLENLGAKISSKVYPGRPHTITEEEIELAKKLLGD